MSDSPLLVEYARAIKDGIGKIWWIAEVRRKKGNFLVRAVAERSRVVAETKAKALAKELEAFY